MTTVLSVLAAIVLLSLMITIHELGHYLMGRKLGFGIVEFAVGMGPVLIKKEHNGIIYALRAIPMGGMCRFYGEDAETGDGKAFGEQKPWKRALVLVAGAFMNIVSGVLIAIITISAFGDYAPSVADYSAENTPAQQAGILPGDVFLKVDGKKIFYTTDLTKAIVNADSDGFTVVMLRDGEELTFELEDVYSEADGRNMMGVYMGETRVRFNIFEAAGRSVRYVTESLGETLGFFGQLFRGEVSREDVGGPVAIVSIISTAVRTGFEWVLRISMLISISIGIFNLMPIPALDGGRLVFVLIEAIRGKPVPVRIEGAVHLVGIILLLGLMVYISIGDVINLFGS